MCWEYCEKNVKIKLCDTVSALCTWGSFPFQHFAHLGFSCVFPENLSPYTKKTTVHN